MDIVLGIQFSGHDTAAALMIDSNLIAACEQERYTLGKHSRYGLNLYDPGDNFDLESYSRLRQPWGF